MTTQVGKSRDVNKSPSSSKKSDTSKESDKKAKLALVPALGTQARTNLKEMYRQMLAVPREDAEWKRWRKANDHDDGWLQKHEPALQSYAGRYSSMLKLNVVQLRENLRGVNSDGEKARWSPDEVNLFVNGVIARRTVFDGAASFEAARKVRDILLKGEGLPASAVFDKLVAYARKPGVHESLARASLDLHGKQLLLSKILHFASGLGDEDVDKKEGLSALKKYLRDLGSRKGTVKGSGGASRASAPVGVLPFVPVQRDVKGADAKGRNSSGLSSAAASSTTTPRKDAEDISQGESISTSDVAGNLSEAEKTPGKERTPEKVEGKSAGEPRQLKRHATHGSTGKDQQVKQRALAGELASKLNFASSVQQGAEDIQEPRQ